ncbi:MAG: CocE/NonD family hydrolase [Anaerolineaceae bacterium]|nr:CocE/NonD family hydrolase [Anaerolineaceae bacterium]
MAEQNQQTPVSFGQSREIRQPFPDINNFSIYIPMKDGIRLAADIFLPKELNKKKLPTLLNRTRYWRAAAVKDAPKEPKVDIKTFIQAGYAIVMLDVRGTGASFGTLLHEWQPQDIEDAYEVVDWIISQSWSDGRIGAYGISYPGTTAELLAATNHPAIKAIWATYHEFDGYTDIALPGGIPSKFINTWGMYTNSLDHNQLVSEDPNILGVKPVDEDIDGSLLQAAVTEHEKNNSADTILKNVVFKDDLMNAANVSTESMLVFAHRDQIESSGIPLDIWGSWMDANTPDSVIRRFMTFSNPQRGVINCWSHGGTSFCDPFFPPGSPHDINMEGQFAEILRFFDKNLHGEDLNIPDKILYYYTLGEGKWKSTPTWPPENSKIQRWYLNSAQRLTPDKPSRESGEEHYKVNFDTTTGKQNRWWTELGGGPIIYADRAEADQLLLTYDSSPMEHDMEITGYPIVSLQVTSTESDGAFFVYLEDIAEDGTVTYLTEGLLRAIHRKVSQSEPPYSVFGPYHSYKRDDYLPLVPGEVANLSFALIPISALVRKDHRIRVAIACADQDTFHRIPSEGEPEISIHLNKHYASWIDLPIIKRD